MKIGTMTFHSTQNYGAVLQAYALQRVLRRLGHESEVIDYWLTPTNSLLYGPHLCSREGLKSVLSDLLIAIFSKNRFSKSISNLRTQKTFNFIQSYLPMSLNAYKNYDELKNATAYDGYITGSDQVWNPFFARRSSAFFLTFVPENKRKIAYATSFGVPAIPEEMVYKYKSMLSGFDHISVREKEGARIVRDIAGIEVPVVLDPTFLLSKEEWDVLLSKGISKKNEYIFCYCLGDFNEMIQPLKSFL